MHTAVATRRVGILEDMEIMCAVPDEVTWESSDAGNVDSVLSSRPSDFAVLMRCICPVVRDGDLMYRWVPCDARTRYRRHSDSALRMVEKVDKERYWVSCGWRLWERRNVGIVVVGLSNGGRLWLRLPLFGKEGEKALEIDGRTV